MTGAGLSEGIIGGMVYEAGAEALSYFEDHVLKFTQADRDKIDKLAPGHDLDDQLGKLFGRTDDGSIRSPIEQAEQARRAAEAFRAQPEAARGRAMMERFGLLPKAAAPEALLPVPDATPGEPDEDGGEGDDGLLHKSAYITGGRRGITMPSAGSSDAAKLLIQSVSMGTYEGLRRFFDTQAGGGSGGSGGIISASYEGGGFGGGFGGGARAATLPNMRYGRAGAGGYRDTPEVGRGTVRGGSVAVGPGSGRNRASTTVARDLSPEARGLLDTIAGTESPGYNVEYGGSRFSSYADHPRQGHRIGSGPNAGRSSDAAGRYQFLSRTWDRIAKKYGLTDFSPASQDKAAWYLAQEDYHARTGRDLGADLKSKDPAVVAGVGRALHGTWTSLPGGIEAGTSDSKFGRALQANTDRERNSASPAYADESARGLARAQGSLLPRPERRTPTIPDGKRIEAMNGGVDFDTSGIERAIDHVDTLHRKLQGLKGVASLDIKHTHKDERGTASRPGALRTALNGGYASDGRGWT